jgi:hypothetical protein
MIYVESERARERARERERERERKSKKEIGRVEETSMRSPTQPAWKDEEGGIKKKPARPPIKKPARRAHFTLCASIITV